MRTDQRTRDYVKRRIAAGKRTRVMRWLKRHVIREITAYLEGPEDQNLITELRALVEIASVSCL